MNRWHDFIEEFSTPGGCIFLLFVLSLCMGGLSIHLLRHAEYPEHVVDTFLTLFGSVVGALIMALQMRAKPPGNGKTQTQTDSVTQTTTVSGPKSS